ncbi:hypothetical protein ALO99_200286 [Pseudomonas coronafaciens pv. porri]|nr:hypothetical protein ALO99_200286 [Pseudomonas coronafaciens pv. porri]
MKHGCNHARRLKCLCTLTTIGDRFMRQVIASKSGGGEGGLRLSHKLGVKRRLWFGATGRKQPGSVTQCLQNPMRLLSLMQN